jgi:alcohol dehydrogenase class IV
LIAEKMDPFQHQSLNQKIIFETGGALRNVTHELKSRGYRRIMIVTRSAESFAESLADALHPFVVWHDAPPYVPAKLADRALGVASGANIDAIVAVGGGAAVGFAKVIALTTGIPVLAVPTTYSGSEATGTWGITGAQVERTGQDSRVIPFCVVYDASLTIDLPLRTTMSSGINALANAIESMWTPNQDPNNKPVAIEGIRRLVHGLRMLRAQPGSIRGREETLQGAYFASASFASCGGDGLHHKICQALGMSYGLPHAQINAVVLPYVLALNEPVLNNHGRLLAEALDGDTALEGLMSLVALLGTPTSLRQLGLEAAQLDDAVSKILPLVPQSNPRPVDRAVLKELLAAAWAGTAPAHWAHDGYNLR